jgi:hypothetical protein
MNKLSKLAFIAATAVMAASAFGTIGAGVATSYERQLGEWHRRIRVDERHERTVLARCILDPGNR